jgi:hypothetical protein
MAHVFLPSVLHVGNFFVFSKWNLFAEGPYREIYDLTWDGGETFLLRDHRSQLPANRSRLFYYLMSNRVDGIRKRFLPRLQKMCKCDSIEYVTLESSLYDFYILKKPAVITSRTSL